MIKLELTLDETNALLANLGTLPYQNVFALIQKIQAQGAPQAEALVKEQEAKEENPVEEAPQQ